MLVEEQGLEDFLDDDAIDLNEELADLAEHLDS